MKQLCENCNYEYDTDDSVWKPKFKIKLGKENWCDNCIADSDIDLEEE